MATYKDFLLWLVALGPKLPTALTIIQELIEKAGELAALLLGPAPLLAAATPTTEEVKLEGDVMAAATGAGAFAAAGPLRDLWAFIKANPELVKWLLTLFAKP